MSGRIVVALLAIVVVVSGAAWSVQDWLARSRADLRSQIETESAQRASLWYDAYSAESTKVAAMTMAIEQNQTRLTTAKVEAELFKHVADSLRRTRPVLPEPEDSTNPGWQAAYTHVAQERDQLDSAYQSCGDALAASQAATALLTVDRNLWRQVADSAKTTIRLLESDVVRMKEAVTPSRVEKIMTAVQWLGIGAALGALVVR